MQQEAVIVRNVMKRYGSEKLVLNGLNLTVSKGSIYGLLGASGCGKTTLLSCIVGIQRIDSGDIWILGGNHGSKNSGIPGPRVGYMPQEISLVGEFTRSDAFYYFGRINCMEDDEIETRQRFLSELLQLPPRDRLVKNMSGGQQRRLSLAAALIHAPELLILDEPTVGLDPILREKIWDYMIKITKEEKITVMITTHYIEEAKDANKIGLMRCGQLLAESSPQQLLEQFQSLEEAFLALSQMQKNNIAVTSLSIVQEHKSEDSGNSILHQERKTRIKDITSDYKRNSERKTSRSKKFKALMTKNLTQFLRHYSGIVFAVLFPIVEVLSFFIGVGGDPKDLTIGVINNETNNCNHNFGVWYDEKEFACYFENLSCIFLHNFDNSIAKEYYDDISKATAAVLDGKLVGIMYFSQNFSESLQRRVENFADAREVDILTGQIQVSLDMGDRQIGLFVQKKLFERFFEIYEDIMKNCKISPKFADPPIRFEDPIYGTMDLNYNHFMIPAFMLTLHFFMTTTISTSLIITDRAEGVWNRSLVQGVTTGEILIAHILTQIIIIIIHIVMTMCLFFVVWNLDCKGSMIIVILLTFFSSFCGLMYGFLISVMSMNHTMANYASIGSFFPLIIMCGNMWPVEGMPKVLRWISYALPITLPAISLRQVIDKGYSIYQLEVYSGFLVLIAWTLFFFIVCLINLNKKSSR